MKNTKRNNKGVTLVTLAIMITVMLIIISVSVSTGIDSINLSKYQEFIARLEYIQTKVNEINLAYVENESIYMNSSEKIGDEILDIGLDVEECSNTNSVFASIDNNGSGIIDTSGFKYYTADILMDLGIDSQDYEYFINIETREVICVEGLVYNEIIYYTLNQIDDSMYNVEYSANTDIPTFDCEVVKDEDSWIVKISNIEYSGNINKWYVGYNIVGSVYISETSEMEFEITKTGTYEIKIFNGSIESEKLIIEMLDNI